MPQFDTFTYTSQVFWLLFCFYGVYFFLVKEIFFRITRIFRVRIYKLNRLIRLNQQLYSKTYEIGLKNNLIIRELILFNSLLDNYGKV